MLVLLAICLQLRKWKSRHASHVTPYWRCRHVSLLHADEAKVTRRGPRPQATYRHMERMRSAFGSSGNRASKASTCDCGDGACSFQRGRTPGQLLWQAWQPDVL